MKPKPTVNTRLVDADEALAGLRFGGFELDLERRELRRRGVKVQLAAKPLELLERLALRAGEVVTRDEIRRALWSDDVHVEADLGINTYVRQVRAVLEDVATAPRFIETVPRRGYRFVAPVERIESPAPRTTRSVRRSAEGWRRLGRAAGILVALGLGISTILASGADLLPWTEPEPRLGVTPFEAAAGDADSRRLATGLTEEVLRELTRRNGNRLSVVSGTLAARHSASGHVRRDGNAVRVTVRLTDAQSGETLWVGSYDRRAGDRLDLETELAPRIARALVLLASAPRSSTPEERLEQAKEAFHLGVRLLESAGEDWDWDRAEPLLHMARSRFEHAVALEPDFVEAWIFQARTLRWLYPDSKALPEVRDALETALALDDRSVHAHLMRAMVALAQEWDLEGTRRELERLSELAPDHVTVLQTWSHYWSALGRFDKAEAAMRRALAVAPEAKGPKADLGLLFYYDGRPDQAMRQCKPHQDFLWAGECVLLAAMALQDWDAAAQVVAQRMGGAPEGRSSREVVEEYWRRERDRLLAQTPPSAGRLARVSMALGDHEAALDWLEAAFAQRAAWFFPFVHLHPLFRPLHGHPRFEALLAQRDRISPRRDPAPE